MKPHLILRTTIAIVCLLISSVSFAEYASINGIQMYYERHGQGTPVVLLHGGYVDSDMWHIESSLLSRRYEVIEIDSRGHGRSTDADVPITYERMADDTLALLDHLDVDTAHFVGWSDGAVIASQIAASRPHRVNQLVLIGAAFKSDVYVDTFATLLSNDTLFNAFVDSLFKPKYKLVNPNPEHWPVFRDKLHELWLSPCYFATSPAGFCMEPLERIAVPTLVMAGEYEIIKRSHTNAIAGAIPGAELTIVSHAGHFLPITRPFKTSQLLLDFLNN